MRPPTVETPSSCHIQVDQQYYPDSRQIDAWVREGYRELVAAGPTVADAAQPGRAAAFLRFLRDAAGSGVWTPTRK